MKHAYAKLAVKAITEDPGAPRTFTGIASTISTDRMDDIVVPTGAKYSLPIPLLWQHDSCSPIGWVKAARVSDTTIEVDCEVHNEPQPGALQDFLNSCWQQLKAQLVQGLSIGFNAIETAQIEGSWGVKFTQWEWLELSPVTIPANQDSSITAIKSADQVARAAMGLTRKSVVRLADPPGASGKTTSPALSGPSDPNRNTKGTTMKTIQERIADWKAKRADTMLHITELVNKNADTGDSMDAEDKQKRLELMEEVKTIDEEIKMLQETEALMVKTATPVTAQNSSTVGSAVEIRGGIVSVKRNLPKGTSFTRYAMALAHAKGNLTQAEQIAKRWKDSTPEVETVLHAAMVNGGTNLTKAAVAAGNTTDTTWAGPLVYYQNMQSEFVELLRPMTIIGKLPSLRVMPFDVRVAGQTSASSAGWVGEGAPKPVSSLGFNAVTLGHAKAAGIVVMTMELARFSSPSAEALVSQDLMNTIKQFLDQQFIDPSVAAVASVSPASITNGSPNVVVSSGATLAEITTDVENLMKYFAVNNLDMTTAVWVMTPSTALGLSLKRTSQDIFTFPDITMQGGTWFGLPVVTSNSVPSSVSGGSIIALVIQSEIFLADDGDITLDVSQEASVQMVSNPSAGAQTLVSLWQNNLVGLRAEREINWQPRRAAAVGYIDQVMY